MNKCQPQIFIVTALGIALSGFALLDGERMSPRPSLIEIINGQLIIAQLPYRYVVLCSILLFCIGLYRVWTAEKK